MEAVFSTNLHIIWKRPRSKSLGDIEAQQNSAHLPTALEQAQENAAPSNIRSRSVCGRPFEDSSDGACAYIVLDRKLTDADSQEVTTSTCGETYEDITENTSEEASSPMTEPDNEDDDEVEKSWSPTTSDDSSLDQDTTLWSVTTDLWSPSAPETPASAHTTVLTPLPEPNTLTSAYLPFSSHLALTNQFDPSTLTLFHLTQTPIFIHSMLQLPCTLSAVLDLPTSDLLCRLTPAILLNHTTYLDATTLLPSLARSTFQSTYHHVNGLVYFPKTSACIEKLNAFFTTRCPMQEPTQTPEMGMRKVTTQVQDSNGRRHDIIAWAWVAKTAEGTEEWWTCEDFVAGRVVGLQSVKW
ncbi:hypothetical protein KCU62_g860, partial [Aureobasidium sp. EXF-3399]